MRIDYELRTKEGGAMAFEGADASGGGGWIASHLTDENEARRQQIKNQRLNPGCVLLRRTSYDPTFEEI